eukprot:TRINITY_DN1477_c0_g1_i1.p1 TRINITY_DN1477_c0_g1~~TRINITY_DN1477_c0_g1_i1.p1  ORF type:complete len:634 (+),score=151.72 TRINITY_DN1477_c0_g1_i1:49-1950(+)
MNALLVILALLGFVNAQITVKWSAGADGDWNTATNWDSGVVPNNATVDVVIDTSYNIAITTAITVGSVKITSSGSLNITANLTTAYVESSGYSSTVVYVGTGGNINALNASAKVWASYGSVQLNGGAINVPTYITSGTELYVGNKNGTVADLWWAGSGDCFGIAKTGNENLFVTNNFTWTGTGDIRDGCHVHVTKYALFSESSDKSLYTNGTLSIGTDAWLDWKDGRIYMYDSSKLNNWGKITTVNTSASTSYYGRFSGGTSSLYSTTGVVNNWGVFNFTMIFDYVEFYGLLVNQYGGMTGYAKYNYCNVTFYTGAHSANLTVEHYSGAIILDANYTANGTISLYSTDLVGTASNTIPVLTVVGSLWHTSFNAWANIYLPPGTNSTFESGNPYLYKGFNIINNGTYWVFSTSSFDFEGNSTFVNWGTFNVAYTSSYIWFKGIAEGNAGSFINVGTMNIKNHFQFRNYFDFLNCGQGQVNFEARSYSDYGYIDFTTPGGINIDGDLNVLWASQSAADTLTATSSMNVFQSLPRTGSGALDLPKVNGGNLYGISSKPAAVLKPIHICFEIGSTSGSGYGAVRTGILPTSDILDCRPLNPVSLCPKWAGESKRQSSGMVVVTSAVVALVGLLALLF